MGTYTAIAIVLVALFFYMKNRRKPADTKPEDQSPISQATQQMVEDYRREKKAAIEELAEQEAAEAAEEAMHGDE